MYEIREMRKMEAELEAAAVGCVATQRAPIALGRWCTESLVQSKVESCD
jgi:hypothetical protein